MRVSGNDDAYTGDPWIDTKSGHVMKYVQIDLTDLDHLGLVDLLRPSAVIVVSSHGSERREFRQLGEDGGGAYVAGVDDVVRAPQERFGLRA